MIEADTDYKKFESILLKEVKEAYGKEFKNGISINLTIKIRNKTLVGVEILKNKSLQ